MKPLELVEQGRFLGEEFLVWLWMQGLTAGGISGLEGDTTACFLDDSVQLVTERGDVKDVSLRRGNPAESMEAFEALSRGMRPSSVKMRLLSGDMEWTFSYSAASLAFSGVKLPPSQAKDPAGRLADRLFLLEEFFAHMDRRFKAFLGLRSQEPEVLCAAMKAWIRAGISGIGGEEDTPWAS